MYFFKLDYMLQMPILGAGGAGSVNKKSYPKVAFFIFLLSVSLTYVAALRNIVVRIFCNAATVGSGGAHDRLVVAGLL